MSRIKEKIMEIEQYLAELDSIVPAEFSSYEKNIEKKAACERYTEKIVEAATDLAFLIIKKKKLKTPQDDADAYTILAENKIIHAQLASSLKSAKGMKNIISHQYGKIDDQIVFEALKSHLPHDMLLFLKEAKKI